MVALRRFQDARNTGAADEQVLKHLNDAARYYHHALTMRPPDAVADLAVTHNQLGNIYKETGDITAAPGHYQQAVRGFEVSGNRYSAGQTRYNIALMLANHGRRDDALLYAHAALADYHSYRGGAQQKVDKTQALITLLQG